MWKNMHPTRIAIATSDGVSVASHLARSTSFLVYELEEGRVISESVRARETDACGNHRSFTDLLEGCRAVICGGIGAGALNSLTAHGITSLVLAEPSSAADALAGYMAGTLRTTSELVCLCGPASPKGR